MLNTGPIPLSAIDEGYFATHFVDMEKTWGKIPVKGTTKIVDLLPVLKTELSRVLAGEGRLEDLQNTHHLINTIVIALFTFYNPMSTADAAIRKDLGYLLLLMCIATNNTLFNPARFNFEKITQENVKSIEATQTILSESYTFIDFHCRDIDQDPYLLSLKASIFNNICFFREKFGLNAISKDELLFHIERKNQKSKDFQLPFNGKLIDNVKSCHITTIDPVCIQTLLAEIGEIATENMPRTQFMVRIFGRIGHILGIDVSYNATAKRLELICVDSAAVKYQWEFLKELTQVLNQLPITYQIIAIQSRLQKSAIGCPIYTLILCNELSKTSFSAIRKTDQTLQKKECLKIVFYDSNQSHNPSLAELPVLSNVSWFPVTVLGKKAIMIGQSSTEMRERLATLYDEKNVEEIMSNWSKLYEFDFAKQKTYYEYHRQSLKMKYQNTPFLHLSEENTLSKLKSKPDEKMTKDLALRRQAAGNGPLCEMEYLISLLEAQNQLEDLNIKGGIKQKTPLHWAISTGHTQRACLILSKGARSDIPDIDEKTAKDYFKESKVSQLKDNAYLKRKMAL